MVNYIEKVQSRTLLSSILGLDKTYYARPLTDAEPEKSYLESLADDINDEELEDWEAELDESVQGPKNHIQDWTDL